MNSQPKINRIALVVADAINTAATEQIASKPRGRHLNECVNIIAIAARSRKAMATLFEFGDQPRESWNKHGKTAITG